MTIVTAKLATKPARIHRDQHINKGLNRDPCVKIVQYIYIYHFLYLSFGFMVLILVVF